MSTAGFSESMRPSAGGRLLLALSLACSGVGLFHLLDALAPVTLQRALWSPAWHLNLIASRIFAWQGDWGLRAKLGWVGEEILIGAAIGVGAWMLTSRRPAVKGLAQYAIVTTPWLTNSEAIAVAFATLGTMLSKLLLLGILGACIGSAMIAVSFALRGGRVTSLALGIPTILVGGALIYWLNSPTRLIFQAVSAISTVSLFAMLFTKGAELTRT